MSSCATNFLFMKTEGIMSTVEIAPVRMSFPNSPACSYVALFFSMYWLLGNRDS